MTDLEGNLGDKAYLTDPNYEGHKFGGWYYDSELLRKCTDVNFPTNTDVLTLYAAWDVEEPTAFVDFEDDPYSALKLKYNGGYYIDGSVSEITDSDAFEGKKALHFNYVGGNGKNASTLNSFALYANGESGKELLKSGSDITYSISFWYKVKSADTDIRVALSTVGANNWYVKNKVHAGGAVIEKETAGGDWNRAVFYVTAKPNTNDDGTLCDSMYLLINPLEDKSCELLIDSVTVQRYGGDKSLVTLSIDDGTTEYRTVKTGDKITLPIPQKENYRFVGWYSDSDYKNSVADVYKVEGNAVLYAKWSLLTTTMIFDDFPADWAEKKSGNFKLTTRAYLTKIDENTALEFKADNEWETALTQMYKAGTSEVIRAAFGDCYRVTFRYMVKSGSAELGVITAGKNNGYAGPTVQGVYQLKSDTVNTWNDGEFMFKAKQSDNDCFHFRFTATDDNADVYIDDVKIEAFNGYSYVEFVTNNGLNNIYVLGRTGDKITYPNNLTRAGYIFGNWYTDSLFVNLFNGTVIGSEPMMLYGKWLLTSTVMEFDDFPSTWADKTAKGNFKLTQRAHLTAVNSNIALEFKGNNWEVALTQMYERGTSNLIRAKANTYYKFKFRYMIKSGAADLEFITAGENNGYAKPKVQGKYELKSYETGVWKETEYVFKTVPSDYDTFHFKFTATADNTDVFIDDVSLEMMENVSIVQFVPNNGEDTTYLYGKTGERFSYPNITRSGYSFAGWYTDEGLTAQCTDNRFPAETMKLYAKWVISEKLVVDFEDDFYKTIKSGQKYTMERTDKCADTGKYSAIMDKGDEVMGKTKNAYILLSYKGQPIELENNTTYIITYRYMALKNSDYTADQLSGNCLSINARTASVDSGWQKSQVASGNHTLGIYQDLNTWMTGSYSITTDFAEPEGRYLYFVCDYSDTSTYCFDNIVVEKVARGKEDMLLNLNPLEATDASNTKLWYVGKTGTEITLPTNLKRTGYRLFGWYEDPDLTKKIDGNSYQILFSDKTLYAGWVKESVKQGFETVSDLFNAESYRYIDKDFEVYNSAKGGSVANVKSGKYSLHRKGDEFRFAAFNPLVYGDDGTGILTMGAGYHMTMWVKIDKHSHTDGAIELATCNAEEYPWSVIGDWKKIAAVKDIADGEWHKITFDFISTGKFISIKSPGNLSIYFDDIDIQYVEGLKATDCSKEVEVTEYVPKRSTGMESFLNSVLDTKLIKTVKAALVDNGNDSGGINTTVIIAVSAVGAVILIAAALVIILQIKKRRGVKK